LQATNASQHLKNLGGNSGGDLSRGDYTRSVVQRHIDDALGRGDWNEAHECLSALFRYLRSDEFGKKADKELNTDILEIIRAFQNDNRIDRRYRGFQLKPMIARIEKRRAGRRD
jgi:hypothetical protein